MKSATSPPVAAVIAAALALALTGCAAIGGGGGGPARVADSAPAQSPELVTDTPVIVGAPYQLGGRLFEPRDVVDFDEVGFAGIVASDRQDQPTANGEAYRPDWLSAAHPTLPIPSYVEVSRLDTGRTVLVRVNDRGPGDPDRAIALSMGAADALGISGPGPTAVRVRRVNPPEGDRRALRSGRAAADRLPTSDGLLVLLRQQLAARQPAAPQPASRARATPAAAPATARRDTAGTAAPAGRWRVQLGAFSDRARADALARRAGDGAAVTTGGPPWRVQSAAADRADADRRAARYRRAGLTAVVITGPAAP